ncbi:MAG: copper chaperone PCu(A)C [Aggregatilineales bacterium]
MKPRLRLAVALSLALLCAVPVLAHEATDIVITGVWARATAGHMAMADDHSMHHRETTAEADSEMVYGPSAAYMTIENRGNHPIRLSSAATDAARTVEIHETQMDGGVMRMRQMENGLEIAAGETAELAPGGYHVMLIDLPRDLLPGEAFVLALTFDMLDDDGMVMGEPMVIEVGVPVLSEPPAVGDVVAIDVWARATAAKMDMEEDSMEHSHSHGAPDATPEPDVVYGPSAVYMTLENRGANADRLVAARTDAAGTVEIHETQMDGGMMRMRPLENGLEIPASGRVMLEPGGYHVMLLDLPRDLLPGEAIALTLVFESGLELVVGAPVREMSGMQMDHMEHDHSHSSGG